MRSLSHFCHPKGRPTCGRLGKSSSLYATSARLGIRGVGGGVLANFNLMVSVLLWARLLGICCLFVR